VQEEVRRKGFGRKNGRQIRVKLAQRNLSKMVGFLIEIRYEVLDIA
jgi:hypothetical protein